MDTTKLKAALVVVALLGSAIAHAQWVNVRVNTNDWTFLPSGVTTQLWSQAIAAGAADSDEVEGYTLVNIEYPQSGNSAGYSGTLHIVAWDNWEMQYYPVVYDTEAIGSGGSGLQSDPSYYIANTEDMVGQTWWYAWFDTDGDGVWNKLKDGVSSVSSNMLEPGGLGEFMPLQLAASTNAATVTIRMCDSKGATARLGWGPMTAGQGIVYDVHMRDEGDNTEWISAEIERRPFICEIDYLRTPQTGDGGIGGATWADFYDGDVDDIIITGDDGGEHDYYRYDVDMEDLLDCEDIGGTPVCTYPVNSQTVTSSTVTFQFTNAYLRFSAMALNVFQGATNGANVYAYTNYMENVDEDGVTRHRMSPDYPSGPLLTESVGPTLQSGTTYYWRVRCQFGKSGESEDPTAWSGFGSFIME